MRTDPATRELQRRAIGTIAIRHHEISTRLSDDYLFTQDGLQRLPSPTICRGLFYPSLNSAWDTEGLPAGPLRLRDRLASFPQLTTHDTLLIVSA